MTQLNLFSNDWGTNSGFKHLSDQLNDLIPFQGRCENPMSKNKYLERFRKAQNLLYDLFNNALMNRKSEFKSFFGFVPINTSRYSYPVTATRWEQVEEEMEILFTPIILSAAKEQGLK